MASGVVVLLLCSLGFWISPLDLKYHESAKRKKVCDKSHEANPLYIWDSGYLQKNSEHAFTCDTLAEHPMGCSWRITLERS